MLDSLLSAIEQYETKNVFESATREQFLQFIRAFGALSLERANLTGHLTASGWIIDQETKSRVLLLKHAKLNKWLQPGGHADGDDDLFRVAQKEVQEETGIIVQAAQGEIFDLDVHAIPVYKDIPAHLHFDVRYLFLVSSKTPLVISHESKELRWVSIKEINALGVDESVLRMAAKL